MTTTLVAPKSRVLSGAGFLFAATAGTLIPGQTEFTVTTRAVASLEATLTTSAAHGFAVGDEIIVSIGDAILDGFQTTITGTTASTVKFATTSPDVSSGSVTGTVRSWSKAGGTAAGSVFTDDWPSNFRLIGVTKEGHEWSYSPSVGAVEVAEELLPIKYVTESVESKVSFEVVQFTFANLKLGLNGGTVATIGGTGATLVSRITPPAIGAETRAMLGWQSEDRTERRIYFQCLQSGDNSVKHAKGTDVASIGMEFSLEKGAVLPAFAGYAAGTAALA